MQLGATDQFPNSCFFLQLPWIRRAPDCPRVREETGARDQGDRSKYGEVSPGEWGKNFVFQDSLQFVPASLEQLTASLAKTGRGNFYNLHEVVAQIYPVKY